MHFHQRQQRQHSQEHSQNLNSTPRDVSPQQRGYSSKILEEEEHGEGMGDYASSAQTVGIHLPAQFSLTTHTAPMDVISLSQRFRFWDHREGGTTLSFEAQSPGPPPSSLDFASQRMTNTYLETIFITQRCHQSRSFSLAIVQGTQMIL